MSIYDHPTAPKHPRPLTPQGALQAIQVARTVRWWTEYEAFPESVREEAITKLDPFFQRVLDGDGSLWEGRGFAVEESNSDVRRAMILYLLNKDWHIFEVGKGFIIFTPEGASTSPWVKLEGD